ncbi:MAG: NAD(P)-binding protein [Minisyncoccales bacterium]
MKIAIIGGGICGLYLAKNLTQNKNKVTVFEKKKTIGKECCSGLFSARIFDFLPEARPLSTNQINRAIINFPKKNINLKFKQPFFVIEHSQIDLLTAALAAQAGTDIRLNQTINGEKLAKIEKEYDCIVGCDGALSPTRNYLAFKKGPTLFKKGSDPFHLSFQLGIQGFEQKRDNSDFVETWATPNGFLWKIPRGNDIEWGIMEKPEIAPKLFNEFAARKNFALARIKSAIIPQGLVIPENERITLCGDASGLTKPWSGGGVIWNLTQANILLKNFPNFLQYRKEALRFFSLRIFLGKTAKTCAYAAGFKFPWLIPGNFNIDGDYLIKK